jgi:eukaryotic-like serine/threonine-protein kinase
LQCLDENTVVALFESALSADSRRETEEHLASCSTCRRVFAEFAAMAPAVTSASPESSPSLASSTVVEPDREDRAGLGRRIAHAQAAKRVGTVLKERWKVERLIGVGGMAQVFLATHRNGRAVAIKLMRPELATEPTFVERFLQEGYVANKVGHPGAVAVLDDDVAPDGVPFLVMELLRGKTLASKLEEAGPFPIDAALGIADAVLDVLAAAHDNGIVHRDIKPDNLFMTDAGETKVLDFGIARLREGVGPHGQTRSGMTLGTIGYMSPEQARGLTADVDARSDLWSVGATLFTLATGRCLHKAATPNEALLLAMTERVAPIRILAPDLPEPVCAILDRALAFEKSARFIDARSMQDAVRQARPALLGPPEVPTAPARRRSPTRIAAGVGAVGLTFLGTIAFLVVAQHGSPAPSLTPGVATTAPLLTQVPLSLPQAAASDTTTKPRTAVALEGGGAPDASDSTTTAGRPAASALAPSPVPNRKPTPRDPPRPLASSAAVTPDPLGSRR